MTAPNVAYQVKTNAGVEVEVHNPSEMPLYLDAVLKPYIKATVIVPK